ncbi:hypothetical protein [Chamaesiphon minutus]|uniref:Uncharacterized protein n=1 Tax=Chamaesiphon minutus (strain ATCC 27169 / PCC 6605) TaxID=1173020 RepID=K9UG08_CHAP6|nr:hypothetical protein [Chamaesiphon minutus]AFY93336.1 hypothetical protein Cha6605_2253 [Chamaesiphon minutus PCC 6605]
MTFSKSNLNLLPESLFTELTADQAQMLEGGKRVTILEIKCNKTLDPDLADELFLVIGGQSFNQNKTFSMRAGTVLSQPGISKVFNGGTVVTLVSPNGSTGTKSLSFVVATNNINQTVSLRRGGGDYTVKFKVTDN